MVRRKPVHGAPDGFGCPTKVRLGISITAPRAWVTNLRGSDATWRQMRWRSHDTRRRGRSRRSPAPAKSDRVARKQRATRTRPPRSRRPATRRRVLPPRGATAGRTARDPATPAHGACHDRNRPHEAPVGRAIGTTWQSHAIGPRTGAPRAAARAARCQHRLCAAERLAAGKATKNAAKAAPPTAVKPPPVLTPPIETPPKTPEQLRDRVRASLLRDMRQVVADCR
jgi:hypothetical protein